MNLIRLLAVSIVLTACGAKISSTVKSVATDSENRLGLLDLKKSKMVSSGRIHTCAIDDDGIKCWGNNEEGQTNVP